MRGLPQKQNARRADKIRLCGHLGRYKKIVKKTYIIYEEILMILLHNADMSRNKRWRMKCKNLYEKYRSIIAEKHNDLSQIDEDSYKNFIQFENN